MKKVLKEWLIPAPWGNIALVSWGDTAGDPVLLVHGRQDSIATFIPLMDYLPDNFHYVGIDMPGNGRSDAFPIGVKLSRFHFVAAVEVVLKHLGWSKFVYIGHSMGCEQGLFYNAVYPYRIKRLILLDFGPSLQRLQVHDLPEYYATFYRDYYDNYARDNHQVKLYSREDAVSAVRRARAISAQQAELLLSRNLIPVCDAQFRLSWDRRLKYPAPQNYPIQYYYALFSNKAPPTLLIAASDETSSPYTKGKHAATTILQALQDNVQGFKTVTVTGGHDVHFTNPERLAHYVVHFINNSRQSLNSKL